MIIRLPSNFVMRLFLCVYAIISVNSHSLAQLSWDTTQKDMRPADGDTFGIVEFGFENVGSRQVNVLEIKSSCGCTTAELAKRSYAPGEKGTISATFSFGERVGLQQKTVMVKTDDEETPLQQLTLRAFIPELIITTPRGLNWKQGEGNEPKTVTLTVPKDKEIKVLGVKSADDSLFAQLKTVLAGKVYEVIVTPNDTTQPVRAVIRVETNYPVEKPKAYFIPVEIGSSLVVPPASDKPNNRAIVPIAGK